MATVTTLKVRLENRRKALDSAWAAYTALLDGQVKQYSIGSRSLTKFDLPQLEETIANLEKEIDVLEAQIQNGGRRRKAVGVIPRDW